MSDVRFLGDEQFENGRLDGVLEEKTISQMTEGDIGHAVCWAMWFDMKGNRWLNPYYSYYDLSKPMDGISTIGVYKTRNGFLVDTGHVRETDADSYWQRVERPLYTRADEKTEWLSVVGDLAIKHLT